jgi:hypothetical protein
MHTLLLDEAGKVLAFGSGANGRLGLGNTATIAKPAEITALAPVTTKSISCGWSSRQIMHCNLEFLTHPSTHPSLPPPQHVHRELHCPGSIVCRSRVCSLKLAPGKIDKMSSIVLIGTHGVTVNAAVWDTVLTKMDAGWTRTCGLPELWMNSGAAAVISRRFWSTPHMLLLLPLILGHTTQCSMGHQHAAVKTGTGDVWVWGSGARGQLGLGMLSARGTSLPSKMPLPPTSAGSVIKVTPPPPIRILPATSCHSLTPSHS